MSSPLFSARVINVAGVTVSALLLTLAWRQMNSAGLAQSLERLGVLPLGAAVLAMMFCYLVGTVCFALGMARFSGVPASAGQVLGQWYPTMLATILLAHLISVAGDGVRLPWMMHRHGLSLARSLALLAFDRAVGFGGALVLAGLSSGLVLWPQLVFDSSITLVAGAMGLVVLATAALVSVRALSNAGLNALIDAYFGGLRRLAEQFFVAVLSCAGIGIAIWALAAAIGANVPVGIALSAAPLVYCGTSIPLTFAGSGSREMSMILALSWSGWTSSTDAVFISLAIGVAILIASMPGAGFA